jgi:predicted metal-dependent hydrolase
MQKQLAFKDGTIAYTLRKSARARRIRLAVYRDGSVTLTAPMRFDEAAAERFVQKNAEWLSAKVNFFKALPPVIPGAAGALLASHRGRRDYLKYKEQARSLVLQKIEHLNAGIKGQYRAVSIRNQKTCWGSCSKMGNLNFNYRILFLPERLQDYVIVHELAHLRELNHSPRFWLLVAAVIPDYVQIRKELRRLSVEMS